jgi:hypothetical protein
MRWIVGVTLALSSIVAAGCGSTETPPPPSTAVVEPWQPGPFERLDRSLADAAEVKCRANTPQASGLPVVLHDQRGDGVDTVVFAGPDARASCQVAGDVSGKVTWLAGSATKGPVTDHPVADGIAVDAMGSTSGSQTGTVSDISGRTGPAIATVRIQLDDGSEITATTSNGWFYAWWPGESVAIGLAGDDVLGRMVASTTP